MKRSGFDTMSKYAYPWYIIFHPFDGFHEMRVNNKGSVLNVVLILIAFFFSEAYYNLSMAFDFNQNNVNDVSIIMLLFTTIVLFFVVAAANWCFCTLLDGKGTFKNICTVFAYALIPSIIITIVVTFLTGFLTLDEGSFLEYALILGKIWTVFIAFAGLQSIHEYSAKKVIGSLLLTVLGVFIILFIAFLFIMLIQQLMIFINTVWIELTRR